MIFQTQTNLTMTMKTPGGSTVFNTVGTVPSNTTTTFPDSIPKIGTTSVSHRSPPTEQ